MFKKAVIAAVLGSVLAVTSAGVASAAASDYKPTVAVINMPFVLDALPQTKAMQEKMAKQFGPREKELNEIRAKGEQMLQDLQSGKYKTEKEIAAKQQEVGKLQQEFQQKGIALQQESQKAVAEEQEKIAREVRTAINAIVKERGIDLVINGAAGINSPIAYAADGLNISNDVIDRVSKKAKKTSK